MGTRRKHPESGEQRDKPRSPQSCQVLIWRVFADVIMLRILSEGDYLGPSEWTRSAITVLIRERKTEVRCRQNRRSNVKKEAEME